MSGVQRDEEVLSKLGLQEQYLCSDESDDMAAYIIDLKEYIQNDKNENGINVPRFGLLSFKARNTPFYVYDHPALLKKTNTAFTDGVHIFFAAGFLRTLALEDQKSDGAEFSTEVLGLHELMHMLLGHTQRLKQFPHHIANKAEDLVINSKIQLAFPVMKWGKTISELGLGFKAGEVEKYAVLAEETVAHQLMEEEKKKKKDGGGGSGGNGDKEDGKPSGKGQSGGQPSDQDSGGEPEPDPEGKNGWSDTHTMTLEDLIKTLEDAGLQNVIDKLQLPPSDNIEEIGRLEKEVEMKDIEAIERAASMRAALGDKMPGGHIIDAAAERIKGLRDGKMTWKLGIREEILGAGMDFRVSDEEPDMVYYLDQRDTNFEPIYVGSYLPHAPQEVVVCILDTSGSVGPELMKKLLSEILTLKKGVSGVTDTASEVILLSADTVLRGEPIEINESNMEEFLENGINIYGRGGTNIAHCIKQTLGLDFLKDKKIRSLVYLSDGEDHPPTKKELGDIIEKYSMAYIFPKSGMNQEWINNTRDYARCYVLEDESEINLTPEQLSETTPNTSKNKLR